MTGEDEMSNAVWIFTKLMGGSFATGDIIKRSDAIASLLELGYAERTAANHMTPSRSGSMISQLIACGMVEPYGVKAYKVIDAQAKPKIKKPVKPVKYFFGMPKEGWVNLGLISDPEKHDVEWKLCGNKYKENCFNLKLYADGRVANKANYWMNSKDGKLVEGKDAAILKEIHPDLYQNLVDDLAHMAQS